MRYGYNVYMRVGPGWPCTVPFGVPSVVTRAALVVFGVFVRGQSFRSSSSVTFEFHILTMRFSSTLVSAAAFFELCIAGYVLEDDFMTSFYDNFNFFTGHDPTNGSYCMRVNWAKAD